MSLKIRLARAGAKKRPYYRIVVADSKSPRDGRYIEKVGTYNPLLQRDSGERVEREEAKVAAAADKAKAAAEAAAAPAEAAPEAEAPAAE